MTDSPQGGVAQLVVDGLESSVPSGDLAAFRQRVQAAFSEHLAAHLDDSHQIRLVGEPVRSATAETRPIAGRSATGRRNQSQHPSEEFQAIEPCYDFESVVLEESRREAIELAAATLSLRSIIFDDWGLRRFEPFPSAALNFTGPPGTGKTMSAHALAASLGRKILTAKVSELESKYVGEGPKRVAAVFRAAQDQNAVLFIDEADALVSRRFCSVSHGSEQSINSMRSELIQAMDRFEGISIFASNMVSSYDDAIKSRLLQIPFEMPSRSERIDLWRLHLLPGIPQAPDISLERLADVEPMTGRDIRRAVVLEATRAAVNSTIVTGEALLETARSLVEAELGTDGSAPPEPIDGARRRLVAVEAAKRDGSAA